MIVRRFMNWLRSTVTAPLGGARSADSSAREPVLVGTTPQHVAPDQASAGLSLSSWLDNGRRLRPRIRLASRDIGAAPTRPLRHKTPPAIASAAELPTPRVTLTPTAPEPTDAQPNVPAVPAVPAAYVGEAQGDDLTNLDHLDSQTRRLMLLRHLVRKRVFNEGFSRDEVPRQYRRSLGMEEPSTQE